jgi:hypothetical protein
LTDGFFDTPHTTLPIRRIVMSTTQDADQNPPQDIEPLIIQIDVGFWRAVQIGMAAAIGIMLITSILNTVHSWTAPYDTTDDLAAGERSGLRIFIDHGTGVQYVATPSGGLTPRLDATGKPVTENRDPQR